MSDDLRKGISTKVGEAITPDSQKNFGQKAKETVTDKVDKVAGNVQPESEKGGFQKIADSFQAGYDDEQKKQEKPLAETAGEYLESAKKYVADTIDSFSAGKETKKVEHDLK